ncbi:hypothetical protein [Sulfitobacter sp. M368]|jgi:hypothetical protein|uniref:hypothetical protein n=1 Tax=Sulfitobacter sp. M368 TaxID=2867021 RepID=UPI0021A8CA30|nr:hypothetical protein [Sulfitobacter sp. M368]UWR17022.1 hypothetical protein K3754_09165 [Sulfitobacter sp. M368]
MPVRELSRILCNDENKKPCQLIVYEHFTLVENSAGQKVEVIGHQEARLLDGSPVNYRSENVFEIVKTGKLLHRVL